MTKTNCALRNFIFLFNNHFKLKEVVQDAGTLRFFGMNTNQNDDYSISIHVDEKFNQLEAYLI